MGIFDFLRNEKTASKEQPVIKEKLIETDPEPQWKSLYLGDYSYAKPESLLAEYTSWVYANIQAIAEAVSQIKLRLYEIDGEDINEVKEHPVLETIYRPNSYMTKGEFIFLLQVYKNLTGESPIRIKNLKQSVNMPLELWPIDPTTFAPKVGKTSDGFEMVTGYTIVNNDQGKQTKINLEPQEVIYLKNMNPRNIWRGMGTVEAAQNSIDTMHYSEAYNLNFFKNSAIPFTVLYTDQKLSTETINRLKDSWNTNYRGVNNSYKTAILEAGLKVERLQSSAKDMDFLEQQRFIRDKLMAMFKTTKIALGITEDVNRANAEASEYVFMKNCIRPKMQQICDSFNEYLLPIFDKQGKLFLDFDDPVPENRELKLLENEKSWNKWKTLQKLQILHRLFM
jgi:HK97 family phage portal protein